MKGNIRIMIEISYFSVFFRGPNYYDISRDELLPSALRAAWKDRKLFSLGEIEAKA